MRTINTSNLTILKAWLIGAQIDQSGNYSEGFHCLNKQDENKVYKDENGNFDKHLIKEDIEVLIGEFGQEPFIYYGDKYKLRIPNEKNLAILVKRICKDLASFEESEN